ncbi:MAG: hypothetical protein HKP60_07625 [Eudoraea sp.]|nr:hypothetical protein [Eudoraea sp.]NNJ40720.1 hypothetical protein [Eudoraea sp.]
MKHTSKLLKQLRITGLLLFTAATSCYTYAQETRTDDEIDLLLDELFFSEEQLIDDLLASLNKNHFLYSSFTLNSNTYFSGRDSGIDQFNFYPQLTYYHPSGFNMSLSGLYYENFDPNWDFTNVSLGYFQNIDEKEQFYFNAGYTRYFFSDGSDFFTNSVDLSLGVRNKNKTFGTALYTSYLFGSDNALQMIFSTYGRLTLLKAKAFQLKFRPQANFLVAQQTIALQELNSQSQQTELVNYDVFALLNTQLNLPISLVSKSWNVDVGYSINFPRAVATETDLKTNGFFTISLGYLVEFKK